MKSNRLHLAIIVALAALLFAGAARAMDRAVLIGGLGGEPSYAQEITDGIAQLRTALASQGYQPDAVQWMVGDASAPEEHRATREGIERLFKRLEAEAKTSDTLLLVMLGHGQSDYVEAKFNLPGPDLAAQDLRAMLDRVPARDQRLVLSFACSGHFSTVLASPGRCILASSDGPQEIYYPVFSKYLLKAFAEPSAADSDRDSQLTVAELFSYISHAVKEDYSARKAIQTEHASLEDDGDGTLTTAEDGEEGRDGKIARTLRLLPAPSAKK